MEKARWQSWKTAWRSLGEVTNFSCSTRTDCEQRRSPSLLKRERRQKSLAGGTISPLPHSRTLPLSSAEGGGDAPPAPPLADGAVVGGEGEVPPPPLADDVSQHDDGMEAAVPFVI